MLTADGAKRLRAVREQYQQHPGSYDNSLWFNHCKTQGCIAGWLCVNDGKQSGERCDYVARAANLLGLRVKEVDRLFTIAHDSAHTAVLAIDAFLWKYGYPPNEIVAVEQFPVPVAPVSVGGEG